MTKVPLRDNRWLFASPVNSIQPGSCRGNAVRNLVSAKLSVCPIPKHDLKPDEFLLTTIRSHDQFNSTIYGLNDRYRGVFDGRRALFLNPLDMEERNLKAGPVVDLYSHFEGEIRKAPGFAIVPYEIAISLRLNTFGSR